MVIEPKDVWSMVGFILYYPRQTMSLLSTRATARVRPYSILYYPQQKMSLLYLVLYAVLGGYVKYFLFRKVTNKGILMYTMVDLFHFVCSVLSP